MGAPRVGVSDESRGRRWRFKDGADGAYRHAVVDPQIERNGNRDDDEQDMAVHYRLFYAAARRVGG